MKSKKIAVFDFGHGGNDSGAVNPATGMKESDVVLGFQSRLRDRLFDKLSLRYTRSTDDFVSLSDRVHFANNISDADVYVSIHCNAANRRATGIETYHYKYSSRSRKAAEVFQGFLMRRFPGHNNRGVRKANFKVLRETNMIAVLIELEFIDTDLGERTFSNDEKLDLYAEAIAQATLSVLNIEQDNLKKPVSKMRRWLGRLCTCLSTETH